MNLAAIGVYRHFSIGSFSASTVCIVLRRFTWAVRVGLVHLYMISIAQSSSDLCCVDVCWSSDLPVEDACTILSEKAALCSRFPHRHSSSRFVYLLLSELQSEVRRFSVLEITKKLDGSTRETGVRSLHTCFRDSYTQFFGESPFTYLRTS